MICTDTSEQEGLGFSNNNYNMNNNKKKKKEKNTFNLYGTVYSGISKWYKKKKEKNIFKKSKMAIITKEKVSL